MLLVEPQRTPLEPLVQRLLLAPSPAVQPLWDRTGLAGMTLSDLLERRAQDPV
jgi:membrane protein